MAGSFARRNTEFFLLDEITSKYLAEEMRGREREASMETKKKKKGVVRDIKDKWQRGKSLRVKRKFQILTKRICERDGVRSPFYNILCKPFCYFQVGLCQIFFS